jgi:hypothetical protein
MRHHHIDQHIGFTYTAKAHFSINDSDHMYRIVRLVVLTVTMMERRGPQFIAKDDVCTPSLQQLARSTLLPSLQILSPVSARLSAQDPPNSSDT